MNGFSCTADEMERLDVGGMDYACFCGQLAAFQVWGIFVCDDCLAAIERRTAEPEPQIFKWESFNAVHGRNQDR